MNSNRAKRENFKKARTCYDHLAGQLGVAITNALLTHGWIEELDKDFGVTSSGERFFADLGFDLNMLKQKHRAFSRKCLDWSERKYHLAGALGHAVLYHLLDNKCVERIPDSRTIQLTEKGKVYLAKTFGAVVHE